VLVNVDIVIDAVASCCVGKGNETVDVRLKKDSDEQVWDEESDLNAGSMTLGEEHCRVVTGGESLTIENWRNQFYHQTS